MEKVDFHIPELDGMHKYPNSLYSRGKVDLLKRRKVSIIGSRKASQYALQMTQRIGAELSKRDVVTVSGAAMGIDAAAHRGAGSENTIAVLPCGIDLRYPAINKRLIEEIEEKGLLLSQFEMGFKATKWSFVVRNELVVSLWEMLVVAQADLNSGSMHSVEYALEMGKKIYVLPHRIGESEGTDWLLANGKAEAIYNIDAFVSRFGKLNPLAEESDPFMLYCAAQPSYEEAIIKYAGKVFEAEFEGKIEIKNGVIIPCRH